MGSIIPGEIFLEKSEPRSWSDFWSLRLLFRVCYTALHFEIVNVRRKRRAGWIA